MSRNGKQRYDAIPGAIERGNEFKERIKSARGDAVKCADLMAEAIQMQYEANGLELIGSDGRVFVSMEGLTASHCLIDARRAYLEARGSNSPRS